MRFPRAAVIACVILASPLLCGTGWGGDAPDASTPKGAMKALLDALHNADAAGAKSLTINADPALIDLMCALSTATAKARAAAAARFGDAAKDAFPDTWAQAGKGIDDSQVKEDGDTAVLTDPKTSTGTIRLKKVGAAWEVDFASLPGMANISATRSTFQKIADANNQVADEIKAGKYATAQDAGDAVNAKMMAAMQSAAPTTEKAN